jgi:hypothetical protein
MAERIAHERSETDSADRVVDRPADLNRSTRLGQALDEHRLG